MERFNYQDIIKPVREAVSSLGERVLNWVLPVDVIGEAFNGVQQESAKRTVEMFTQEKLFEE